VNFIIIAANIVAIVATFVAVAFVFSYVPDKLQPFVDGAFDKPREPKPIGPLGKVVGWTCWLLFLALVACFSWQVAVGLLIVSVFASAPCDCCHCRSCKKDK
jgi:hypothetical protein